MCCDVEAAEVFSFKWDGKFGLVPNRFGLIFDRSLFFRTQSDGYFSRTKLTL